MGRDMASGNSKESYDRLKFIFLSVIFFFVIGGYTVAKELKDSVFVSVVGRSYIPWAKILSNPINLQHCITCYRISSLVGAAGSSAKVYYSRMGGPFLLSGGLRISSDATQL